MKARILEGGIDKSQMTADEADARQLCMEAVVQAAGLEVPQDENKADELFQKALQRVPGGAHCDYGHAQPPPPIWP